MILLDAKKLRLKPHKCKWCNKSFTTEKTIANHLCPKKKRYAEKDTKIFKYGLYIFRQFYKLTTNTKNEKTEEEFIKSSYYIDFIKFSRYVIQLQPVYPDKFIHYVIRNGTKLKDWTSNKIYESYLIGIMKTETPDIAFERSIVSMNAWAEEERESYVDFFKKVAVIEAVELIKTGKISPWVLFLSESAELLFERFDETQYDIIKNILNPDDWKKRINGNKDDAKFIKNILKEAGI